MDEEKNYSKCSQKDYTSRYKFQLVGEVENGALSLTQAKMKFGIQNDSAVQKLFA